MRTEPLATPVATQTFTAVFEEAEEGGYIAFVEELPGANTQGETLDEARENLREAIELILETNRRLALEDVDSSRVVREPIVIARR
jgi:predicted RNase H-like HicB family nuclease